MASAISSRQATIGAAMGALIFQLLTSGLAGPIALPGCPESCGNISVPYPFGIGEGCFYEGFSLTCNDNERLRLPKLFMGDGVEVLDISLPDGTVRINSNLLLADSTEFNGTWSGLPAPGPFNVSSVHNWFVAIGCNILAQLLPLGSATPTSSCAAMCADSLNHEADSICSPIDRCRTPILQSAPSYSIKVTQLVSAATDSPQENGSLAAFIVQKTWFGMYEFSINLMYGQPFMLQSVPVVLEWTVDSNWRCNGSNITIGDEVRRLCSCSEGYDGNPYLVDGCQDPLIVEEEGTEDAEVVARLAEACLSLKGEERPTMRQVETTLEDVQASNINSQINRTRKNAPNGKSYSGSKGGEGTRQYRVGVNEETRESTLRRRHLGQSWKRRNSPVVKYNVPVLDVSLPNGTARIHSRALNASSSLQFNCSWSAGPLAVSTGYNVFVAMPMGCNLLAHLIVANHDLFTPRRPRGFVSICAALCLDGLRGQSSIENTSWSGEACRRMSIS
ncbi:hypothetical protein EJB05_39936, partial [Eragrostis curvula]